MAGRREGQPVKDFDNGGVELLETMSWWGEEELTITRRKATKTRMYPAMETRMGGMEETREPKAGKASI